LDVITLFKKLITMKSETPDDGGILDFIAQYLPEYEAVRIDKEGVKNLFVYKKFGAGDHLCFAGHVDVVPAGEGWQCDPYGAVEQKGYIYGRGTQDMKSGVAAFVQTLKTTTAYNGTLSLLLTSDEEGDATYGTVEVLRYLDEHEMLPDAVIVAEPTSETVFGDAMKVGRRGSINGTIELRGKQGHAAYPEKAENPIHRIAPILESIAGVHLDEGDAFFSPSRLVITDIRSGMEVTNVTPGSLKMMFNVRNATQTDAKSVEALVRRHFKDTEYTLTLKQSAHPFMTDVNAKIVTILDESIAKVCQIEAKHSTAGGTSDARFIAPYGIDVVEFGVKNDRIHAPNERTSAAEVIGLYDVFCEVVRRF